MPEEMKDKPHRTLRTIAKKQTQSVAACIKDCKNRFNSGEIDAVELRDCIAACQGKA